jgi:hypothetical protein
MKRKAETDLSRYDWSRAVRGRHAEKARRSIRLVAIEPALFAHFGSAEAVNEALRALVAAAATVKRPAKKRRTARE